MKNNERSIILGNTEVQYDNVFRERKKRKSVAVKKKDNIWLLLLLGVFIGFINGFWGGGGGMLCVPVLTLLLKMPDKEAHATTILIMLPLCLSSFIIYLLHDVISWNIAGIVTSGFVIGGVVGAYFLKKINNVVLRVVFSLIIIAGGIRLLF